MQLKKYCILALVVCMSSLWAMEEEPAHKRHKTRENPNFYLAADSDDEESVHDRHCMLKARYKKNQEQSMVVDLNKLVLPLSILCISRLLDSGANLSAVWDTIATHEPIPEYIELVDAIKKAGYRNKNIVVNLFRLKLEPNDLPSLDELDENLCEAAFVGDEYGFKLLISHGARLNNYTAKCLEYASRKGHIAIVKLLLDITDHDLREGDYRWLLTHSLTFANNKEIVQMLTGKGAELQDSNNRGNNCLASAVYKGNLELIDFLLENNASPFYSEHGPETTPIAAVIDSMQKGNTQAKNILKKFVAYEIPGESTVLTTLVEIPGANTVIKDAVLTILSKETNVDEVIHQILLAIENGYVDVVELLLNNSADITLDNNKLATAFKLAELGIAEALSNVDRYAKMYENGATCASEEHTIHLLAELSNRKQILNLLQEYSVRAQNS